MVSDCECRIIKKFYCHSIGSTFESDGGPSPAVLIAGFKSAFGEKMTTVHLTVKLPDGRKGQLNMQIIEIAHADNSGELIDFRANVDPADGFGRVICGRCDGLAGKTCISIESI